MSSLFDSEELGAFDANIGELLSDASKRAAELAEYLVWTKDFDDISPPDAGSPKDELVTKMVDAVNGMVGPIQKDLERAIAARSKAIWSPGHRSGRLHNAALSRLTVFKDDRAFRRRQESRVNDVAVTLLVDCSGSMTRSNKIKTACYAAYALGVVLERIRVSSEVLGFTTSRDSFPHEESIEQKKLGVEYARHEAIVMPIFKGFSERMTPLIKTRIAQMAEMESGLSMCNNVDGESVQIAAQRLSQRTEKRKILIVLSDGYPSSSGNDATLKKHLLKSVLEVQKAGIDVLGIGIKSDAVKKFYPKSVVLQNVSDLPTTVIGEIRRLLIQG